MRVSMRNSLFISFLLFLFSLLAAAQTPESSLKPSVITGEVVSVTEKSIVIKAGTGQIDAVLSDKTEIKKVSAENPSLSSATSALLSDIGVGDKIAVTGVVAADGRSVPARAVYLMSKAEIARKQAKETEQWRTRGLTGRVVSVDVQAKKIVVETRSLAGASNITVSVNNVSQFLRYAPDSIRFDEAKKSALGEIQAGDMLRALGDRGADGTSFSAEQIVTGAFQTIAGTVKSVDIAKNEIVIKDLNSGKDLTILTGAATVLKKFPAEMAERLAGNQGPGAGRVRPAGAPPSSGPPSEGRTAGGGGQRGARGAGGIDEMIDRFPDITPADLKAGDMIAISSTKNGSTDRIKAIKLLAGVEPFLRMAQASSGRQGGQGVQGSFSIPGLDGMGLP